MLSGEASRELNPDLVLAKRVQRWVCRPGVPPRSQCVRTANDEVTPASSTNWTTEAPDSVIERVRNIQVPVGVQGDAGREKET